MSKKQYKKYGSIDERYADMRRAVEMRKERVKVACIAREFGVSPSTINRWVYVFDDYKARRDDYINNLRKPAKDAKIITKVTDANPYRIHEAKREAAKEELRKIEGLYRISYFLAGSFVTCVLCLGMSILAK